MSIDRVTVTKFVLLTNAALLVIGTVVEMTDHPLRNLIMSGLFITWIITFFWHLTASRNSQAVK